MIIVFINVFLIIFNTFWLSHEITNNNASLASFATFLICVSLATIGEKMRGIE